MESRRRAGETIDRARRVLLLGMTVAALAGGCTGAGGDSVDTSATAVARFREGTEGMQGGVTALYQKCVHLGCRVPWCKASQWFECPCHGSQYNRVGEKKAGPAPRGMDHFAMTIGGDGAVTIDTATVITGVPIGTNTTGQEAEGPNCVSGGSH